MNNLIDFDEFQKNLESTYNELNEKNAFRGFGNKLAHRKIKSELKEEIEISQSIMGGIREGLESLSDDFEEIKKSINSNNDDKYKGEKSKLLDSITKLIDQSRKSSWNLTDLIDEGEIDYAGFTANVGFSTLMYFGVLLFPIRTRMMVHKGYNYFFTLVKNTIRKSLVMLQLNFDQFENLIITKSFQSSEYMNDRDRNADITEFYTTLSNKLFDEKSGMLTGQKGWKTAEKMMQLAKQKIDLLYKAKKSESQSLSAYNCLDTYNNTYTKSLETLRNYAQEDIQKQLDAIKTTITKLAADDKDYLAYGEMIIAAAEEHAYKVSSTIYSRFAKMAEVFSLPNQKKMIDLIQEASKEKQENAAKEKKELLESDELKANEEKLNSLNEDGAKIFSSISGASIGKLEDDGKYKNIVGAYNWTYEEYKKLKDEDKDTFVQWLTLHKEVCEKCHDTLKVLVVSPDRDGYFDYINSLIDYIEPCLGQYNTNESHIQSFTEYIMEKKGVTTRYYFNLNRAREQSGIIEKMYKTNRDVAIAALEIIGGKFSRSKFVDNAETIVDFICKPFGKATTTKVAKKNYKYVYTSLATYTLLENMINLLKEERNQDYPTLRGDERKGTKEQNRSGKKENTKSED
jgi:hypothetical protein